MVESKDRDLVGFLVSIPRPIRTRFVRLARTHGVSARAVIQGYMTQFTAEQARAFGRAAAQVAAAQVVKAREQEGGGKAA